MGLISNSEFSTGMPTKFGLGKVFKKKIGISDIVVEKAFLARQSLFNLVILVSENFTRNIFLRLLIILLGPN